MLGMGTQLSGAPPTRNMALENQHPWASAFYLFVFLLLRTWVSVLLNSLDCHMAHRKLYTSSVESLKTFKKFYVKFLHSVLLSRSCIFVITDVMFRVDCQCDRIQNCLGDGLRACLCAVLTEVGRHFSLWVVLFPGHGL